MAKKRNRAKVELAEQAIKVLLLFFLFAYAPVVAWWNNISPTGRILIISLITIAVLSAIGAIITLSVYIKRQRMVAWNRAMIYLKK